MTVLDFYGNVLVELNKEEAPTQSLFEFNYYLNKSIQECANIAYNTFETTQQTTDYLQAIKRQVLKQGNQLTAGSYTNSYRILLPLNYWHLTNVYVKVRSPKIDCGKIVQGQFTVSQPISVKKANDDMYPFVEMNEFDKPNWKEERVYYHIYSDDESVDSVSTKGWLEIITGNLGTNTTIDELGLRYLKEPNKYTLTYRQLDVFRNTAVDESQVFEFPNYVCNEIVKKYVALTFEQQVNERLQSNIPINQSIQVQQ